MLETAYRILLCSVASDVIPSWNDLHMPHTGTAVYDKRGGSPAFRESQPVICVYRHIRKNLRYRCHVRLLHGTYICRRIIPDWVYTLVRLICLYSMRSHAVAMFTDHYPIRRYTVPQAEHLGVPETQVAGDTASTASADELFPAKFFIKTT